MSEGSARRLPLLCGIVYLVVLGAYAGASGRRLLTHSNDNHYVYLADGWLHGRLDLGGPPPHSNDWSQVEWVTLRDGRLVKGAFASGSQEVFKTLAGKVMNIPAADVAKRETRYYVSFPPFPGLAMLPLVAVFGMKTNDVLFTLALAPLASVLLLVLLARLRARGDSDRSQIDDLWLVFVFALGSVFYYASVRGEVWYTAHVTSVIAVLAYALCSLDARRPVLAGLALACGFLSRPEILFLAPLFLWEVVRTSTRPNEDVAAAASTVGKLGAVWRHLDRARLLRGLVLFAIPIALLGCAAGVLNTLRFGRFTEFGHTYLNVIQAGQIKQFGLFNLVYLGRNLACAFALTPTLVAGPPFLKISWHGQAMWVTTPVLLWVLWPTKKGPLHTPLWLAIACTAIPNFFYQNSGYVQFGYRFALDYLPLLVVLIAVGGRRLGWSFKALAIYGFAINLFGAITFYWAGQHYFNSYFPPGIL